MVSPKASLEEIKDVLERFMAEQENILSHSGVHTPESFYPMHWYLLEGYSKKAPLFFDHEKLKRLYFHMIRKQYLPYKEIEKNYALWEAAYQEQTALMVTTYAQTRVSRIHGLTVYGYDRFSKIDSNQGFSDYVHFRKVYKTYCAFKYWDHMAKKPAKFIEFAADERIVKRLCAMLRAVEFCPDEYLKKSEVGSTNAVYEHSFWGAVFTVLLARTPEAAQVIKEFKDNDDSHHHETLMRILAEFEAAAKHE